VWVGWSSVRAAVGTLLHYTTLHYVTVLIWDDPIKYGVNSILQVWDTV